jgi:hypothetical protein
VVKAVRGERSATFARRAICASLGLLLGVLIAMPANSVGLTEKQERQRCLDSHRVPRYTVYALGTSFDGLARTGTSRNCLVPGPGPYAGTHPRSVAWYSTVVYGSCTPEGFEGGCGPPLEVQSWPECDRDYSLYGKKEPATALPAATSFRLSGSHKIPTAQLERGLSNRIELYTGQTTVVVFAGGPGPRTRAQRRARAGAGDLPATAVDLSAPASAPRCLHARMPARLSRGLS